ncbi:MAG: class I SAM-dependent methyltransferase [Flavobacteriaceae bacterium]|nr:class I SAM-dependent methyltransferase [Flavobacteriaceae bacterium]
MEHHNLKLKDFLVSQEEFSLKPHSKIDGLLQTHPIPIQNLDAYYASDDYISHSKQAQSAIDNIYYLVRNYNLKLKFKLLQKHISGEKILDFGCGTGDFVKYLHQKNLDSYGYEPNPQAYEIAQQKVPNQIFSTLEFLEQHRFDVITLWHVLEHIPDLFQKIDLIQNSLQPKGKLFIAVPNYESFDAQYYGEYWAAYDVPRHLWHFNQKAMKLVFNQFGMIIENTYPMYFDAYYVSLLSEKYSGSSARILKALTIGSISNLKAIQNGQFSSLIYQIRREN